MEGFRYLIVTADDFGIGPATTQGILELANLGIVTSSVLLVTSPFAEEAVKRWRQAACHLELGWHPCLTLDRPLLPPSQVPTLVDNQGCFYPLGTFLKKLLCGRIVASEIRAELFAQYCRFRDLVGHTPAFVNSHHHIQVFSPVGRALMDVLRQDTPLPYLRRVHEPFATLVRISGARIKRTLLSTLGKRMARLQASMGFPGNDGLLGITNPSCVARSHYLTRWIAKVPGRLIELTCHPGHWDSSLLNRDAHPGDGQLLRRVQELQHLKDPQFLAAVRQAGFRFVKVSSLLQGKVGGLSDAA